MNPVQDLGPSSKFGVWAKWGLGFRVKGFSGFGAEDSYMNLHRLLRRPHGHRALNAVPFGVVGLFGHRRGSEQGANVLSVFAGFGLQASTPNPKRP